MTTIILDATTRAAVRDATSQQAQLEALIAPWSAGQVTLRYYSAADALLVTCTHAAWAINTSTTPRQVAVGALVSESGRVTGPTAASYVIAAVPGGADILRASVSLGASVGTATGRPNLAPQTGGAGLVVTADAGLPAAPTPSWRAGLTNGVWKEISGTTPSSYSTTVGGAVSAKIMDAYSGFFVGNDPGDDLIMWGGGHNDYSGNEVLGLNLWANAPAIRTICEPTAIGDRGTGVPWWGTAPNQKPAVPHTYDSGIYSPDLGRYVWVGQSSPGGEPSGSAGSVAGGDRMFSMVASTGAWVQPADDLGQVSGGKAIARDASGTLYWPSGQTIRKYVPGVGQSELVNSGTLSWSGFGALVYDSTRDKLLRIGDYGSAKYITINCSDGTVTDVAGSLTGSGSVVADLGTLVGLDTVGACYDQDNDRYIVPTGSGGQFYAIDAGSWAVTLETPSTVSGTVPNKAVGAASGIFGRVKYVPRLKGVAYYPSGSSNCWFLPTATL